MTSGGEGRYDPATEAMMPFPQSFVAAAFATLLCTATVPVVLWLSHRFQWYDVPNARKIHTGDIPRLGGVGIFVSFIAAFLLASLVFGFAGVPAVWPIHGEILFVLAGMVVIHVTGLVDDFYNLKAIIKFLLQIIAAALVTMGGFLIRSIPIPFFGSISLGILSYPVTVLWIVGITNALNLVDGIDGFAGGITAISALSMGFLSVDGSGTSSLGIPFILCGAVLGFLFYNYPPARIFMGDSGALFLGFTLAVIPLLQLPSQPSVTSLLIPVTILTIPILDTASAIIRRTRKGLPFYSADREHIHHKLQNLGLTDRKILLITYSYCAFLGVVCCLSRFLKADIAFLTLVSVWVLSILCFFALRNRSNAKSGS